MVPSTVSVLLVDDDAIDAQIAARALEQPDSSDYHVVHVESMAQAVSALAANQFDVVLLDLGLPGSIGIETLEDFRQHDDRTPVVVLSGLDDEVVAIQSLERDAQDYLCKDHMDALNLRRAIRYSIQRQRSALKIRELLVAMKEKEALLQRKNERLEQLCDTAHKFVDNVSHEFRTPLTVIKEYVSLISEGMLGETNDEQTRFLKIVEDRANDLNTMVDDMLDVSKLESGLLCVQRRCHSVRSIVDRIVPVLQRKADVKEIRFETDIPEDLPLVYCDAEKVERVLVNLTVNAMKFTKPGGRVSIAARTSTWDVVFCVSDEGVGIAEHDLEAIFERFEQVHDNTRDSTKGFGLGLNIAKELVELNFGRLSVESQVGIGSSFSFTAPQSEPAEITKRYLKKLERQGCDSLTLIFAAIEESNPTLANDVDSFLRHTVRGSDLIFRASLQEWAILLPEPGSEVGQVIARMNKELASTNRNRPRGPLPEVLFNVESCWPDVHLHIEDIVDSLESRILQEQAAYV